MRGMWEIDAGWGITVVWAAMGIIFKTRIFDLKGEQTGQ
jgi:hypothetical protein